MSKLDILAIGIHPDDVELSCGGTIAKHVALGKKVGMLDLSRGELGTRGNAELRTKEANEAAKILGASVREQLNFKDGFFTNDPGHQLQVIQKIRQYQPEIVLCNAVSDRHPDHARASRLVDEACFYSGLLKIETQLNGEGQKPWRPKAVYHYIQDHYIHPDFIVNITGYEEIRRRAIFAYASQFYDPKSNEPTTPISTKEFLEVLEAKISIWGRTIGAKYGEGYTVSRHPGVNSFFDLL